MSDDTTFLSENDHDVLWGVPAIARAINRSKRQTYHLLSRGVLRGAAKKTGGRWSASRRKLVAAVTEPESA
jgi:hypothetical protein